MILSCQRLITMSLSKLQLQPLTPPSSRIDVHSTFGKVTAANERTVTRTIIPAVIIISHSKMHCGSVFSEFSDFPRN
jgi:hypothetical protein